MAATTLSHKNAAPVCGQVSCEGSKAFAAAAAFVDRFHGRDEANLESYIVGRFCLLFATQFAIYGRPS